MEHNMLTLDFWQDAVTYEGHTMPTGSLGCSALNISKKTISTLDKLCVPLNGFMGTLQAGMPEAELLPAARESAVQILDTLVAIPPFSYLDRDFYAKGIKDAFTPEGIEDFQAYTLALMTGGLNAETMEQHRHGILLGRLTPVLAQLGFSLREYKNEMTAFAEKLNGSEVERTPDGFAACFGEHFKPERIGSWMDTTNISVQYVSAVLPGDETPRLVKRMHFVSFVGMLRADLFEGLCVGHAPRKCPICGRWFLTTNARHTKYCGGLAPGDKLGRTCRQIGNLRGREQRELADDHPLKMIYERRLNTINRSVSRGSLDRETAAAMKKLAKDKLLRAISDSEYAKDGYVQEMEQDTLMAEARKVQ